MSNATTIENERWLELQEAQAEQSTAETSSKEKLSFGQKVSKHWLILGIAAFFDLLGLIPYLGIVFNFIFGLVLFLYFGPKSVFKKVVLPIAGASFIDFFTFGIMPANIATNISPVHAHHSGGLPLPARFTRSPLRNAAIILF